MATPSPIRLVFYVSDGTGLTAESLGAALLPQFITPGDQSPFREQPFPFIGTLEKARQVADYITHAGRASGLKPIVFSTTVEPAIRRVLSGAEAVFLDLYDQFMDPLSAELGNARTRALGRAHGMVDSARYHARIEAMNYALEHDDGQSVRDLSAAGVILIAPSRCGKTPTSLYMALQYGVKTTNFPLTDDDLAEPRLPKTLEPHRERLFGLTHEPERLARIRAERRPGSKYASLAQCAYEIRQAEVLYRRLGIPNASAASMSIEEIAATILQERGLRT